MKIGEATTSLQKLLTPLYGASEAANIARMAVEFVTEKQGTAYLLSKNDSLTDLQINTLQDIENKLLSSMPIQYITHEAYFQDMKLWVGEGVLIPRPETEEIVEKIISETLHPNKILDIGTGSGCIALALKKVFRDAEVIAMDISPDALTIAKRNSEALDLPLTFIEKNILEWENQRDISLGKLSLIVSNPPYICEEEKAAMHENVLAHEPASALFVPDTDPLLFYRTIAIFAMNHLEKNGKLYFEINERFGNETVGLLESIGFGQVQLMQDLQGKDRCVSAIKS